MTEGLINEVKAALSEVSYVNVSFVGHSLGAIILRCALAQPSFRALFHQPTDMP